MCGGAVGKLDYLICSIFIVALNIRILGILVSVFYVVVVSWEEVYNL
jgi:hypothetical protein